MIKHLLPKTAAVLFPLVLLLGKEPANKPAIETYVQESLARGASAGTSPGSLYVTGGLLADVARDLRANQIGDLVTIVVADKASAIARGGTNTSRKSSAGYSVGSIFGRTPAAGALANLAQANGENQLQGQGETSRETVLSATLTARVTHVLPNGNLVLEAQKEVAVNSEKQMITVRGVVRPNDLGPSNLVRSDRLAFLEVAVNGKGVVGDAVRRPFILYRLLMGLLPL